MADPGDQDCEQSTDELNHPPHNLPAMRGESRHADFIGQDAQASKGSRIAQKVGPQTITNINLLSHVQIHVKIDAQGLQGIIVVVGLTTFLAELLWLTKRSLEANKPSRRNSNSDLLGSNGYAIEPEVQLFSGRLRENFLFEPTLDLNPNELDDLVAQIISESDGISLFTAISSLPDQPDLPIVLHAPNDSLELPPRIAGVTDPTSQVSTQKGNNNLSNPHRKSNDPPSRKRDAPGVVGIPIIQPEIPERASIPEQPVGLIPLMVFVIALAYLKNINSR